MPGHLRIEGAVENLVDDEVVLVAQVREHIPQLIEGEAAPLHLVEEALQAPEVADLEILRGQ